MWLLDPPPSPCRALRLSACVLVWHGSVRCGWLVCVCVPCSPQPRLAVFECLEALGEVSFAISLNPACCAFLAVSDHAYRPMGTVLRLSEGLVGWRSCFLSQGLGRLSVVRLSVFECVKGDRELRAVRPPPGQLVVLDATVEPADLAEPVGVGGWPSPPPVGLCLRGEAGRLERISCCVSVKFIGSLLWGLRGRHSQTAPLSPQRNGR
jgi:hypothetical protein